ncbi:hypothetical protein JW979_03130 [bacterium]|nr:hypothetical protein [candidate division CSSED10-310 bacterium]
MKTIKFCFMSLILTSLVMPSMGVAREFNFTIGVDYWKADWELSLFHETYNEVRTYEADGAGMYGPRAQLAYGPVSLGVSYMMGKYEIGTADEGDREDILVTLGYSFARYFSANLKYESFDYSTVWSKTTGIDLHQTGFGAGLSAFVPLGKSRLFLFGVGSYSPFGNLDIDFYSEAATPWNADLDASRWSIEGGLGYTVKSFTLTAGYRHSETICKDDDYSIEFGGVSASLSYTF